MNYDEIVEAAFYDELEKNAGLGDVFKAGIRKAVKAGKIIRKKNAEGLGSNIRDVVNVVKKNAPSKIKSAKNAFNKAKKKAEGAKKNFIGKANSAKRATEDKAVKLKDRATMRASGLKAQAEYLKSKELVNSLGKAKRSGIRKSSRDIMRKNSDSSRLTKGLKKGYGGVGSVAGGIGGAGVAVSGSATPRVAEHLINGGSKLGRDIGEGYGKLNGRILGKFSRKNRAVRKLRREM